MTNIKQLIVFCSWGLLIAFGLGCGDGTGTLDEVDPEAAPANPTYAEHVAPIVDYYCLSCHSKDSHFGAQEGYAYDTCEQVKRGWGEFYETTVVEKSMPPGGALRVTSSEALILTRWREQGSRCE